MITGSLWHQTISIELTIVVVYILFIMVYVLSSIGLWVCEFMETKAYRRILNRLNKLRRIKWRI